MTVRECAIVEAFTGICMLAGNKRKYFYEYVEEKLGRPVFTHELADDNICKEIKMAVYDDFIELCRTSCDEIVCHCNVKENAELIAKIMDYDVESKVCTDVVEVKHGRWIEEEYSKEDDWGVNNYHFHICSECHKKISNTDFSKSWICCPYCGADMRGKIE